MRYSDLNDIQTVPTTHKFVTLRLIDYIKNFIEVEAVVLFGSRARGNHRQDSDTDLLVVTSTRIGNDLHVFGEASDLNKLYNGNVGLSLISKAAWEKPRNGSQKELKGNIERDGIVLTNFSCPSSERIFPSELNISGVLKTEAPVMSSNIFSGKKS